MSYNSTTSDTVTDKAVGYGDNLIVLSGGKAEFSTVTSGGTIYADSGGTLIDTTISVSNPNAYGGAYAYVNQGGVASASQIYRNGEQAVDSGGNVYATKIFNGGTQNVDLGTAYNTTISAGGEQFVGGQQGTLSGAVASGTNVLSGGLEEVAAGGVDYDTEVHAGGVEFVDQGGVSNNLTIDSGGTAVFDGDGPAGQIYDGNLTFSSGNLSIIGTEKNGSETLTYYANDTLVFTVVSSGGTSDYFSGGHLYETDVQSGNYLYTSRFTASGTQVYSSINYDYAGEAGSGVATVVNSGGTIILAGGTTGYTAHSGAKIDVGGAVSYSGGVTSETVQITGVRISGVVANAGVAVFINSGNTAVSTTVNYDGKLTVSKGGVTVSSLVSSGGSETVNAGGTTSGSKILDGSSILHSIISGGISAGDKDNGLLTVSSGGRLVSATVSHGGILLVESGGVASNTHVTNGDMSVERSGKAIFGTIKGATSSTGTLTVAGGGIASGFGVSAGGAISVLSGGTSIAANINSGGLITISSAGNATSTTIAAGGKEYLSSGTASMTVIESGGTEIIAAGGSSTSATVQGGGFDKISAGGYAVDANVKSNGNQTVFTSGKTAYTSVGSGGKQIVSGGTATGTHILTSGTETVYAGGIAYGTVLSGGTLVLSLSTAIYTNITSGTVSVTKGAFASGTNMSGGTMLVAASGTASGGDIFSGGSVTVASKGVTSGLTTFGIVTVQSGGSDKASQIGVGGAMLVLGTATGETIFGAMTVYSGGTASNVTIEGGTLELNGGRTTGAVTFSGSAGNFLADKSVPSVNINGFAAGAGNIITLGSVTYAAGASAVVTKANVVTIIDDGTSYNLNIIGAKVGETDFTFGPGSELTRGAVNNAKMSFVSPPASEPAPTAGPVNHEDLSATLATSQYTSAAPPAVASAAVVAAWLGPDLLIRAGQAQPAPVISHSA
jgi:autotransporter passenger strand-loop-strand repeat protein